MAAFNPNKLRSHLERNRTYRDREQQAGENDAWYVFRSPMRDYERTFADLFPGETNPIYHFKERRRERHEPIIALDLMSDGQALRSFLPERGLAVTLTDQRTELEKSFDQSYIDMINGDVLDMRVWNKVISWVRQHGDSTGKFNLILGRGEGALEGLPNDPALLYLLVERLYELLSSDGGMMVVQLPRDTHASLDGWSKKLSALDGLEVVHSLIEVIAGKEQAAHYPKLKIIKHTKAPTELPPLQL